MKIARNSKSFPLTCTLPNVSESSETQLSCSRSLVRRRFRGDLSLSLSQFSLSLSRSLVSLSLSHHIFMIHFISLRTLRAFFFMAMSLCIFILLFRQSQLLIAFFFGHAALYLCSLRFRILNPETYALKT